MITLSILCIIWGIISYFRIKKICDQKEEEFNIFYGSFFNYMGFLVGFAVLILTSVILIAFYLP